jgi:hypothetical protein
MKVTAFLVTLFALLISVNAQKEYVGQIEKWRADHEAELKSENGWLTVAGLFWLKDGANTVGAGSGFDIELTENFRQGKFGTIDFQNGKAVLKVEPGVDAQLLGRRARVPPHRTDQHAVRAARSPARAARGRPRGGVRAPPRVPRELGRGSHRDGPPLAGRTA